MKNFIKTFLVTALAVLFVMPFAACGEKIVKLKINLSVYNVEEEANEEVTLTFKLYEHLADVAVGKIKDLVKNDKYENLPFYVQSKYKNLTTSSQIMLGAYKLENGKLVQNEMPSIAEAEFLKNGTTGSNLSNDKGAIGLWRDWDGSKNYTESGYALTNATMFISTVGNTAFNGNFCLIGHYEEGEDILDNLVSLFASDTYYTSYTCYYQCNADGTLLLEDGKPVWVAVETDVFDEYSEDELETVYAIENDDTATKKNDYTYEKYTVSVVKDNYLKINSITVK